MIYTVEVLCDDGHTVVFDILAASEHHALDLANEEALEMQYRPTGQAGVLEACAA